jgi:hypothetical protein
MKDEGYLIITNLEVLVPFGTEVPLGTENTLICQIYTPQANLSMLISILSCLTISLYS